MAEDNSYGQVLRSSAVMGGAQALNYAIGLVRVKAVAVLLGPGGVGIVGLYTTATNLLGSITDLGLQRSAVRTIAQAHGQGDSLALARAVHTLRRLCWITGGLGWLASVALAIPMSRMLFQSTAHAWAFAVLGAILLLNAITGGQSCVLRGMRRIGDIARMQVTSAALNTVMIIVLYAWLRERGIVPVLLASAAIALATSWWFVRRIQVPHVRMSLAEAATVAKPMIGLGLAMMTSTVLTSLLELYTRGLLSREFGLEAVGIYQAAWALSALFASFVLSAMGTDFYPRLSAVIHDRAAAGREIDQQTEIGILIALPGLLATLALAKWVVWALYSAKFMSASVVLVWLILGVFGRVVSWPLGYVQLAMNAGKTYVATEIGFIALQGALVTWLLPKYGLVGAGYAFFGCYALYFPVMMLVTNRLLSFRHSAETIRLMSIAALLMLLTVACNRLLPDPASAVVGLVVALVGGAWCLHELARRLGARHRLVRKLAGIPGISWLVEQDGKN